MDWRTELIESYLAADWSAFVYCLGKKPELLEDRQFHHSPPFLLAIHSGNLEIIRSLMRIGADVNVHSTWYLFDPSNHQRQLEFERRLTSPHYPTAWGTNVSVSGLVAAHLFGFSDIYADLVPRVSDETRFQALYVALMTGDEAWANSFDLTVISSYYATPQADTRRPTPALAALYGGCSLDCFTNVYRATPSPMRAWPHYVDLAPPGHEEGNNSFLEGDLQFWARHLQRQDVEAFIKQNAE